MKARRLFVYVASSVMMLLVLTLLMRVSVGDLPVTSASAQGLVLSVAELAPTERIIVDYVRDGCRDHQNWRFELIGGTERRLTVIDAGGSYDSGEAPSNGPSAIGTIYLSSRDCRGIDDLLRIYRHPDGSSGSTTTIRIRVSYFRDQEKIGVERFVDQGMIENWIWQRDQERMAPGYSGVTPEMLSFPDLVRRAAKASKSVSESRSRASLTRKR